MYYELKVSLDGEFVTSCTSSLYKDGEPIDLAYERYMQAYILSGIKGVKIYPNQLDIEITGKINS